MDQVEGLHISTVCLDQQDPQEDPGGRVNNSPDSPVWESQPWYPALLAMLVDYPILLLTHNDLLTDPFGQHHPLIRANQNFI